MEVGSGAGYDAYQFCKYGADYTGIDITPANPLLVQKHLGFYGYTVKAIELDVEKMEYVSEFDLVYSYGVLHHVPNIEIALKNMHTALKHKGESIIIVYNKNSIFYRLKVFMYDFLIRGQWLKMSLKDRISQIEFTESADKPLVNLYTKRKIRNLIQNAGFEIISIKIRKLTVEDLPSNYIVERLYKYIPQSWLDKIGTYFGWYICVHAVKK